MESEIKI